MKKTILVIGASRGIGAAVVRHFTDAGHRVLAVSRTPAVAGDWIQADVSTTAGIAEIFNKIGQISIDTLLFMAGTWEVNAFTQTYDFTKSSDEETRRIMSVNVIAPIEITKGIINNLSSTTNPRAIYVGALSGLSQHSSPQVAYTASKFALRGAIQALRTTLQKENIGFTVINPGNVATDEVLADINEGHFPQQTPIPIEDLISAIEWVLSVSSSVEVGDINLIQKSS